MHSEVEIKQNLMNHVLLSNSINFDQKFILFCVFVDCGASDNAFIDQFFAQEQDFELLLLEHSIEFSVFNKSDAKSELIIHYCYFSLSMSRRHRVIKFYVTFLPQWKIVLELSWLKINRAILDFDKLQMIYLVDKLDVIVQIIQEMIFVFLEFEFNSGSSERSAFEKVSKIFIHFDIAMINAISYLRQARKSDHVIDAIIMKNINKVLNSKKKVDSATILPPNLQKFQNVFSQLLVNNLSKHRFYDHVISLLKEKTPSFEILYKMFQDELLCCRKYLNDMLKKNFIHLNHFSTASLVLFVKKLKNELRFCVDYRNFNVITIKNRYSISLIREILHRLIKVKVYIKLDIIVVYNALRMILEKEWKTAFRTRYDFYEYLVMLFDLVNTSSSWQNFINDILHEDLNVFCIVYLDDILIYNDNQKDHDRHVEWIFIQLRKVGIQCDIEKSEFNVQEVKYLNLIIGIDDIRMNSVKIKIIFKWKTFKDVKEVFSFHDFVNFYRRFIENFSLKVLSLTRLTNKNVLFVWIDRKQKVFDDLKQAFAAKSILTHYDFEQKL